MNWLGPILEPVGGIALALAAAGLMFVFSLSARRIQKGNSRFVLRPMAAMQRLRRAIGLAVEDGSRLHVSIGEAGIISSNNASALVGLSTLERVGMLSSVSDRPPVATSGEGTLALLSQDTLHAAYRIANISEYNDPAQARLAGVTPFSYVVGTLPVAHDERVSAHILVGNFGPEIALLNDAAERENAFVLAASDAIAAQSVFYALAGETLIGEELFAIPAYLRAGPLYSASLRAQDVMRWIIVGILILGSILAFFQSL